MFEVSPVGDPAAVDLCLAFAEPPAHGLARARELMTLYFSLKFSTRACKPNRFGSFKLAATWLINATFFATASTQCTVMSGQHMAITMPGKPAPEPTSSRRNFCSRSTDAVTSVSPFAPFWRAGAGDAIAPV